MITDISRYWVSQEILQVTNLLYVQSLNFTNQSYYPFYLKMLVCMCAFKDQGFICTEMKFLADEILYFAIFLSFSM